MGPLLFAFQLLQISFRRCLAFSSLSFRLDREEESFERFDVLYFKIIILDQVWARCEDHEKA